jgi:sterol desaturase/sphingolipid hydroxylase (fatty acid hydroxylase superfamily)
MSEPLIRLSVFLLVFITMAGLEVFYPRRSKDKTRGMRWFSNIGISFINSFVLRLLLPFTAVSTAIYAEYFGYGLFNYFTLSSFVSIPLGIIFLDVAIYAQHVLFHKVPFFWRFHKMHHADIELDVTSGIRFHPVESLISMVIKCGFVMALGVSPFAVLLFEIILNASSMFNHSNVKLPFDSLIRRFIVTPDMHRIHHSIHRHETDSNYGFNLSIWDRLFKTYTEKPQDGHLEMTIGLNAFRGEDEKRLDRLMTLPFRKG